MIKSRLMAGNPLRHNRKLSSEEAVAIRDVMLSRAAKARRNVVAFFEFVMREEHTRAPISVLPHQKLALEFILHHNVSVNIWTTDAAKTFTTIGLTLFLLGQDHTQRGAVVSYTQGQAAKIVNAVRDYIETSHELHMVFPSLKPSRRSGDPWTQTALTVDRPAGIKDPSLIAIGIDSGAAIGSRLSWVIADDLLTSENTATKERRDKVATDFDNSFLSRQDKKGGRVVIMNSAWHSDDYCHRLEKRGIATLRMSYDGRIDIQDSVAYLERGEAPFDSDEIRPSKDQTHVRLVAHDPDPDDRIRLWPERFTDEVVANLRINHLEPEFNRLFRAITRDDATAMCKSEYVELCKRQAREAGVYGFVSSCNEPGICITGVDLAIREGEEYDDSALVTFRIRPDGKRVILDIEAGQWSGPDLVRKIYQKAKAYNSLIMIENNGGQAYIKQFVLAEYPALPVKCMHTGRQKASPEYGVPSFFLEMANGLWLFPNSKHGVMHPHMQRLADACLYYIPTKHTDDILMAMYMARELAKKFGLGALNQGGSGGVGAMITSR